MLEQDRPTSKLTPLMAQYWDIKQAHEDKVVLFRMGDFFEMFHRDAEIAAPVLGIALTSRNKKSADETPMCGVPHHSVAGSINKLLANGFKVAICDQIEDPKLAKGLVKRAVTRILSPGVVYDPDTLDGLRANYLASFDERSVSFLDTTTGESFYFLVKDPARARRLLTALCPVELVLADSQKNHVGALVAELGTGECEPIISVHEPLDLRSTGERAPSPMADWPASARRLLSYVVHMQGPSILETVAPFERRELLDRMELGATAIRHLEVFETYKGEAKGSLFHAINRCKTSSGARLLRSWLQFPLTSLPAIERRHQLVEQWRKSPEILKEARSLLGGLGDVQRRLAKIGNPNVNPRDLQVLAESLKAGLEVSRVSSQSSIGVALDPELIECAVSVARDVDQTLADEPPVQLKNGGVIRAGVSPELDELNELSTNSHELIMKLEAKERELTGISSLKIRYNNVFGYYIEITNTHKEKVPKDRYDRKQTLANAERYLTSELAELETKVLSAQSKRIELETKLFSDVVKRTLACARKLLRLADLWAEIDVASSLAHLALEQDFCRPTLESGAALKLKASRHPVIEQLLPMPFIANDIELSRGGCLLLTGPNMAGKSTLMRQVAIAALLAQSGSFVPARSASMPIFDRIFTRIGASDFLSEGLSTFMVEMKETAEMLEFATEDSLVILDEVGRGTSTYDGMSLAQAILEFLLENRRAMTLFATHYQELTELSSSYAELRNVHMRIHDSADGRAELASGRRADKAERGQPEITFLYQLSDGPASKSYGIHVAKLAGLPASVTRRASAVLRKLEGDLRIETKQMTLLSLIDRAIEETNESGAGSDEGASVDHDRSAVDVSATDASDTKDVKSISETAADSGAFSAAREIATELAEMDLSRLTPLDALNQIAKWQRSLS